MENNMNNHVGMEERGNSGHNKSRHFNKNKKRFDKNHMSDNARSNDRDNERANDKKGGENFHKNNHKKNGEFRHKNHGDSFKRFDSRKRHKEYRRSENDIDPNKVDMVEEVYDEQVSEATPEKKAQPAPVKADNNLPPVVDNKDLAEKKPIVEEKAASEEKPVKLTMPLVNDFNIEKDYGSYKQPQKVKREENAAPKKMVEIIGVRFRKAGKVYYFSRGKYDVKVNDYIIVETARGVEYGRVVLSPRMIEDGPAYHPLKTIIRVATPNDKKMYEANKKKEKEAFDICLEKIKKHGLEMKLIDCEYTFDNNKVLFYFTADGRIDFRELVKDLASVFRTRIELRQIGVRDETKIVGSIGTCGRPLCCHTYLSDFAPVSIRMAKEQNLSLNPTKISGVCGRLMCCLNNEEAWYEEANMKLPYVGDHVVTNDGFEGEVHSINAFKQIVRVIIHLENDEKEAREYKVDDLKFERRARYEKVAIDDELRKLEMLEKHDIKSNLEDE